MLKRFLIVIVALVIIFGGIFAFDGIRNMMIGKFMSGFVPPPVSVTATQAKKETWDPFIFSIGTLQAMEGVDLSPQQSGVVNKILFESGQTVKAGTPLVIQNTEVDKQDLLNYEATQLLTKNNYNRIKKLNKRGFSSQEALDEAFAKYQEAQANVQKTKVIIEQKTIRAPFTGILGIRNINIGEFIQPGSVVVNIQQLNPLRAIFTIPQQQLDSIKVGQPVQVMVPGDTSNAVYKGKITAIDSKVNQDTRNMSIQAEIQNPKLKLRPGMYINVHVMLPQQEQVITIPQTAISFNPYGDYVYVVNKGTKTIKGQKLTGEFVKQVFITPGQTRGGQVAVLKGLKAGDTVVTSGQLKLQPDSRVNITESKGFDAESAVDPSELH